MNYRNIFLFAAGAAAGAVVSWIFTKRAYESLVNKELSQIREAYGKREPLKPVKVEVYEEPKQNDILANYKSSNFSSTEVDYSHYGRKEIEQVMAERQHPRESNDIPYVIDQVEFAGSGEYEYATLLYYVDNDTLIDDSNNEVIDDPSMLIGDDILEGFAKSYDKTIYVRNERISMEYEIIKVEGEIDYENLASIGVEED